MKFTTAALALALAGFGGAAQAQQTGALSITGAGSSFAAPLYSKWAEAAAATGIRLNYQGVGSGAGINQINRRTVDFGATDMPLTPDKLAGNRLLQIPTAIGAVVVIVNLPGVEANRLKLTGEILADIYLGRITRWNDAKLVALNPDLKLPSFAIAPVYRADGSGTSFVFTDYLSLKSPDWQAKVGAASSVRWPAGNGAKGNDGIAATVKQVRGAIGYVESAYAIQGRLTTAMLRNRDGRFVAPDAASFAAAAASADWGAVKNFAIDLNDQPGAASWPIESATFILLPTDPEDPARSAAVRRFFDWGFSHGGPIATGLRYIPLPRPVQDAARAAWAAAFGG